jgi:pyruvate dehydrogenase complex dehydrogenase (E1) component
MFEIDPAHIAAATMAELARCGAIQASRATKAIRELGLDPEKTDALAL